MLRPGSAAFTYFSVAIVCLLMSVFFGMRMPLVGTIFALGTLYFAGRGVWAMKEDPYDLRALRKLEETKEFSPIEESEFQSKYCPHCDIAYPANSPICPECGRLGAEN